MAIKLISSSELNIFYLRLISAEKKIFKLIIVFKFDICLFLKYFKTV